ncbi:MAG: AraC family transcriptional regulator [Pseudomonadota bacterium]
MSVAVSVRHGSFGRAAIYELNKPIIPHGHREGHLIFYLDGAPAVINVSGKDYAANRLNGVAVSPWEPHSFDVDGSTHEACLCLVLYIKPIWFLEASQTAEFTLNFGRAKIRMTDEVQQWVHRLTSQLLEEENESQFNGYLYGTTAQCYQQSWKGHGGNPIFDNLRSRFSDYRVRRSLRLMQDNFADTVEMESLAREVGLSRPHFFKLFKKQMGVTPNLYLNTLRSEKAIEYLMKTDKTVSDIGFDLGFSSQASFTRFFASNVGIPPSDYRRVANVGA